MSRTVISIVFLLASIAAGFFYLKPQWSRFQDLGASVQDAVLVSAQLDDLIKNQDKLLSSINAISKENLARMDEALPQNAQTSLFLVALENYANANGLGIKRVDLASPGGRGPTPQAASAQASSQPKPAGGGVSSSPGSGIDELPFGIQVSGPYDAFKRFLFTLEHNIRLIDVKSISFNSNLDPSGNMTFTVSAKTYYQ